MGQLIKFPDAHPEQIALTPGLGRNTGPDNIQGKSTNMLNAMMRLLQNKKEIPEAVYYSDVNSLTSAGELNVAVMDKAGKGVSNQIYYVNVLKSTFNICFRRKHLNVHIC